MMSRFKDTIQDIDKRISDWATPKSHRAPAPMAHAPIVSAPREEASARTMQHVSEADLEAAVLALRNMSQLRDWVKSGATEVGYAAGGRKAQAPSGTGLATI